MVRIPFFAEAQDTWQSARHNLRYDRSRENTATNVKGGRTLPIESLVYLLALNNIRRAASIVRVKDGDTVVAPFSNGLVYHDI